MKEKDFQMRFTRWLNYRFKGCGAFELKICHEKSLPFSAVADHQVAALLAVKNSGLCYKIPDDSRGTKPFDCFRLQAPAFVVVMFYQRGCDQFYLIDVDQWVAENQKSQRRSLTEERASMIATIERFS